MVDELLGNRSSRSMVAGTDHEGDKLSLSGGIETA
jgi:hypothetical protein